VRLPDGSAGYVKHGDTAAEVAGLRWLAVPGGPPLPEVLGEDPLVTRLVPAGRPTRAAAEEFGRRLAVLHAAGADAFGSPPPGGPADALIGRAPMRNAPAPSWPEWYARDRVLPYVRAARDAGTLDAAEVAVLERAAARVAAPAEPPARLHGDLWSGNVLWDTGGRPWLIDPAAYGGHREVDLTMLRLFRAPSPVFLAAYEEVSPLAAGHEERVELWQLLPLLVHAVLFGGSYGAAAERAARRYA
jgi:fructosamine-3-kinase